MATPWYKKATLASDSRIHPPDARPAPKAAAAMSTRAIPAALSSSTGWVAGPSVVSDATGVQSTPGQGYDSFTARKCAYPLESAPLVTVPANAKGQQVVYDISSITSASDLRQKIAVSAEASFSGFGVDVGAKAQWSRDQATSVFSSYLLVKITVRNARLSLGAFQLNADAKSLVGAADFLKQFYRRYGDCFISDYVTGGEFLGLYQFQARSARERQEVAGQVEAAGLSWKAKGDFAAAMDKIDSSAQARLSVFIDGGQGALPAFDPKAVLDFAQNFPVAVGPDTGFPVLYDTETTDYYKATGFPTSLDLPFAANHRVLDELAKEMDRVRRYRSAVLYILANRKGFEDKKIDDKEIRTRLEKIEGDIIRSATTLAENAWQFGAGVDLDGLHGRLDAVAAMLPEEKEIPEVAPAPKVVRTTTPGRGFYVIVNKNTGRVFDIPGYKKDGGAIMQMWDRHQGENQLWRFEKQDDGSYIIRSLLNNLVLDISGKNYSDGAELITWTDNGGSNQRWRLDAQQDGSVIIRSVMNDKAIDIERYHVDNGAKLHIWKKHGDWNQCFYLEEALAVAK